MGAVAAASLVLSGCTCGPCLAPGEYELYARRQGAPGDLDGGSAACPTELDMTLVLRSETAGRFVMDGGVEGDCALLFADYRPQYACQARLECTSDPGGSRVTFTAFATVGPGAGDFVDGRGGTNGAGNGGLSFAARGVPDGGCEATYSWAAALRRRR